MIFALAATASGIVVALGLILLDIQTDVLSWRGLAGILVITSSWGLSYVAGRVDQERGG